jgi:glycosyltransferase involved in cell wall biosynthesis
MTDDVGQVAGAKPLVSVIAYSPAPYRVEFFDEIVKRGVVRLHALYVHRREPGRFWKEQPLSHPATFLNEGGLEEAGVMARTCDLFVVGYFADPKAGELWKLRRHSTLPWTFWGERPGAHRRGWLGKIARRFRHRHLHRSEAPVWAIGSWAAAAYREELGSGRVIEVLPYFSDLSRFTHAASQRKRVEGKKRLLFTGSLDRRKGVDLLLEALSRLGTDNKNWNLTIAGSGKLEQTLMQRAEMEKLPVNFIGFTDWEQLPTLHSAHDIMIVPSRYDGWGMVIPEGLASGLPVIATDQMGAAFDLVRHGHNGWIACAGDASDLAAQISSALSVENGSLDAMSAQAMESVNHHQLEHGCAMFERLVLSAQATNSKV